MNELLEELYQERHATKDAMAYHMPKLRELASRCQVCVEFGVRRANTTVAMLSGNDKVRVYSYDVERHRVAEPIYEKIDKALREELYTDIDPDDDVGIAMRTMNDPPTRWTFTIHNSVTANVPRHDLLIHDSLHDGNHVYRELNAHAWKTDHYLCFHDSVSHGQQGQVFGNMHRDPHVPGILAGIEKYMKQHPGEWKEIYHDPNSSGFLVFERVALVDGPGAKGLPALEP